MLWIWVTNTNLQQVDVLTHIIKNTMCAFLTETMERPMGFTLPTGLMPARLPVLPTGERCSTYL